ncbi:MAG: dirigent protein [Streptosporangiaceae bacterium]
MLRPARFAAIGAGAVLLACAMAGVATAASGSPGRSAAPLRYYAFDVNNGGKDPGFIAVAGTSPTVFAQGDELIINDQLTSTHQTKGGYPIVGYDSGICTLTRIPEKYAEQTIANCVVTAVWNGGSSLSLQGAVHFRSQQPEAAVFAVTGGTGRFSAATGTADVSFTKNYKILTLRLR